MDRVGGPVHERAMQEDRRNQEAAAGGKEPEPVTSFKVSMVKVDHMRLLASFYCIVIRPLSQTHSLPGIHWSLSQVARTTMCLPISSVQQAQASSINRKAYNNGLLFPYLPKTGKGPQEWNFKTKEETTFYNCWHKGHNSGYNYLTIFPFRLISDTLKQPQKCC